MPIISLTRLRIRSLLYLPAFFLQTRRTIKQVEAARGFLGGALLPDRQWTFWTVTAWDGPDAMRSYILAGAHRDAMPRLTAWCDEASVAHWDQQAPGLPSWTEADIRMRRDGRPSKLRHPSPNHASMTYRPVRAGAGQPIRPRV